MTELRSHQREDYGYSTSGLDHWISNPVLYDRFYVEYGELAETKTAVTSD